MTSPSSALIQNSRSWVTLTSISLMPLGFGGSHSQRWENSSLSSEIFFSDLDPYFKLQPQRTDWEKAPRGFDGSVNFRQKVSKSGMLKLFSSVNIGDLSLHMDNLDSLSAKDFFSQKSSNYYLNANYRDIIGDDWTIFLAHHTALIKIKWILTRIKSTKPSSSARQKLP
jgi:hypothetical protein